MTDKLREFSTEERRLIRRNFDPKLSDADFDLFIYRCELSGLDPLIHEIYALSRWSKKEQRDIMSVQTGIDGYRTIAERSGVYAGSDDYEYGPMEGKHPEWARSTVYKLLQTGERAPFTATAYWDEYCDTRSPMWSSMPRNQLGKCAEALALRKGFPRLSGIYTDTEMEQTDREPQKQESPSTAAEPQKEELSTEPSTDSGLQSTKTERPAPSESVRNMLHNLATGKFGKFAGEETSVAHMGFLNGKMAEAGQDDANRKLFLKYVYGDESSKSLDKSQWLAIGKWLTADEKDETGDTPFRDYAMAEFMNCVRAAQVEAGQDEFSLPEQNEDGSLQEE